ncbi:E7 [Human papillomavirus 127]|uniref:Protein E7 n=1 Tax=Human papillomavirus 127 TaxID=746832 RepID=E0YDP5_9PAPI|nr:E7 [Human papillomavirus 127]ADE45483.1 E7 [Human papillomavirus 127]
MRGEAPTLPDVVLDTLVLPANLLSNESLNESLSPDEEPEEEQVFRVDSDCHFCRTSLRLCVVASDEAIRQLQVLLVGNLRLLCPGCARNLCGHHGRTN